MVYSSFSIQYQSTGVGSLHSLDEIKLVQSIRGLFEALMALLDRCFQILFCIGNPEKYYRCMLHVGAK